LLLTLKGEDPKTAMGKEKRVEKRKKPGRRGPKTNTEAGQSVQEVANWGSEKCRKNNARRKQDSPARGEKKENSVGNVPGRKSRYGKQ